MSHVRVRTLGAQKPARQAQSLICERPQIGEPDGRTQRRARAAHLSRGRTGSDSFVWSSARELCSWSSPSTLQRPPTGLTSPIAHHRAPIAWPYVATNTSPMTHCLPLGRSERRAARKGVMGGPRTAHSSAGCSPPSASAAAAAAAASFPTATAIAIASSLAARAVRGVVQRPRGTLGGEVRLGHDGVCRVRAVPKAIADPSATSAANAAAATAVPKAPKHYTVAKYAPAPAASAARARPSATPSPTASHACPTPPPAPPRRALEQRE